MDIIGKWKIAEANVFDKNFKQTWKTAEEIQSDPGVNPMQKAMSRGVYAFEEDGTLLSLFPKDMNDGSMEAYDDEFIIGNKSKWKEEDGKLFTATEENGELEWNEAVPTDNGFELLRFHRIVKF
ncbi:MAG: hypothetical protein IKP95_03015 [Ruminococcus sp.]|nr:hypothetical protein [Ruminococcus sp.]